MSFCPCAVQIYKALSDQARNRQSHANKLTTALFDDEAKLIQCDPSVVRFADM